MPDSLKSEVREGVLRAYRLLITEDGDLFDCPTEENDPDHARKLHEVCLNHRLANHLEKELVSNLAFTEPVFVDIEFNRDGFDLKKVKIGGSETTVRPDIIIHNRTTGPKKFNFLAVECKKDGASLAKIGNDE